MDKLTEKGFWDAKYEEATGSPSARPTIRQRIKGLLGPKFHMATRPYHEFMLLERIFPEHLPQGDGLTLLEIGSAPGEFLATIGLKFGYDVHGVEYSQSGVEVNRAHFEKCGLPPENIQLGDFFDDAFLETNRGRYDMVLSRGFIEHFTDPEAVIDRHVELLKPGGTLIITIPHLLGFNYFTTWIWDRKLFPVHNLDLMRLARFRKAFDRPHLSLTLCGLFGAFTLSAVGSTDQAWKRPVQSVIFKVQMLINLAQRAILRGRWMGNRFFAPQLIAIATKKVPHPDSAKP
jgi:2-polyprenyl-3-methyl-5-hydroxy-6-metoxy-1,4-benzoquinol methylase